MFSTAAFLQPFTDVRVHVKPPLNRNWYPRTGIGEGLWICDTYNTLNTPCYTRKGLRTDPRVQNRFPVFRLNKFRTPTHYGGHVWLACNQASENLHRINDQ